MSPLTFAYYCSGHGYGHATRVSAFATHLRNSTYSPTVYIISSAPQNVFSQALNNGALYRNADIDPVIVQPVAYHVDRRESVNTLEKFLAQEERKIDEEASWLLEHNVDCVLSDAAYLACKSANAACIPSVLITNFTFDSVYSYLSIKLPSQASQLSPAHNQHHKNPRDQNQTQPFIDEIISQEELKCLVNELYNGYRCAELLIRLPGNIPIPSFEVSPQLPSHLWTSSQQNLFYPDITKSLSRDISSLQLHPSIPYPITSSRSKPLPRKVLQGPLIVRPPSQDIYTPAGRKRLLDYIGVPEKLQSTNIKILTVSFGGQKFRKPIYSQSTTRSHSLISTPTGSAHNSPLLSPVNIRGTESHGRYTRDGHLSPIDESMFFLPLKGHPQAVKDSVHHTGNANSFAHIPQQTSAAHLWLAGALPAAEIRVSPVLPAKDGPGVVSSSPDALCIELTNENSGGSSDFHTCSDGNFGHHEQGTPVLSDVESDVLDSSPQILPDSSWIAIVCGASTSQKKPTGNDQDDQLPENFFVAPRDIYMPDLMAIADVLLGKLGYGTVSECIDTCTPFVYVSRPLFIEEHGLRCLLDREGTGVELTREQYEAGDWAAAVERAWYLGESKKTQKREKGDNGERQRQGELMAMQLVEWVYDWQNAEKDAKGDTDDQYVHMPGAWKE